MELTLFALFVLGLVELSASVLSVPDKIREGFPYTPDSSIEAPVEIDLFLDMTCPDSKAAFPVAKQVADYYKGQVLLRVYMFPLPFHRASYLACRSVFAVNTIDPSQTYAWMQAVFDQQTQLGNGVTANMGDDKIMEILRQMSTPLGLEAGRFIGEASRSSSNQIQEWKYGCSRAVYATPTAFVNDVLVDVDTPRRWTLEDWVKVIQPHLETAQQERTAKDEGSLIRISM